MLEIQVSEDTFINDAAVDNNNGVTGLISVGNTAGDITRGLLKFDISALPANANIISAVVALVTEDVLNDTPYNISLHRSLVEWYEGDGGGSPPTIDGSTWDNRNHIGTIAWTGGVGGVAGTEYAVAATATTPISVVDTQYLFDVTPDVQDWYMGIAPNHGWWIIGDEGTADSYKAFDSNEGLAADEHPLLTILYTVYQECSCNRNAEIPQPIELL